MSEDQKIQYCLGNMYGWSLTVINFNKTDMYHHQYTGIEWRWSIESVMQDVQQKDYRNIQNKALARRMKEIKEGEEFIEMC